MVEIKWFQFHQKFIDWRIKQDNDQFNRVDRARERSIAILQKRYGFTQEKAAFELSKYYSKARLG
jgi:hypothetical protein